MTDFAATISTLRKNAGLTQEQLGDKLGISYQAVSKWENGVSCPDISTLPLIADIFGTTIDELFGREVKREEIAVLPQPEDEESKKSFLSDLMDRFTDGLKTHIVISTGDKNYSSRKINDFDLLPWADDDKFRAVLFHGHKLIGSKDASTEEYNAKTQFEFTWNGDLNDLISDFAVIVNGNVYGDVDAGGNVTCGDVECDVDAGGAVSCGDVSGDVEAGANVTCGDVSGDVEAGVSVTCGRVDGSVEAGVNVTIK